MSAHGIRRYSAKKVVNRGGRDTPSHNAIEVLGANVGNSLNCEKLSILLLSVRAKVTMLVLFN